MARWVRWNNPTIKPPFGAQIDWSNPITEGLSFCTLFRNRAENLIYPNYNGIPSGNPDIDGDAAVFDNNSSYIVNNYKDIGKATQDSITVMASLLSFVTISPDNKSYRFLEKGDCYFLLSYVQGYGSGGQFFAAKRNNTLYTAETNEQIDANKKYLIIGKFDGVRLYTYVNTKKFVGDTVSYIDDDKQNLYIGSDDSGKFWNGKAWFTYIWNRALSDDEILAFNHEPYSFFLYPQYWYLVDFGGINSIEYSSPYDILNKNEYNNKYDIQTKTEKNIKYDLLAQNSYVSKYDILTKRETDVGYDILAKADYSINYDILNRLTKEVSYDILSAKEYNSRYDVLTSLTTSILYNILTKNEYNVTYDILGTSAIEYTIKYDILNSAQTNIVFDILSKKEANIKYNILISHTSNIVYDILAKTLTSIIYDILAKKETTFSYNIINKKETNFKYDILATKLYTNIYNILTKSEYKILYDILSDITIRPEVIFKLDKQDTILKVRKSNTIFVLDKSNNTRNY